MSASAAVAVCLLLLAAVSDGAEPAVKPRGIATGPSNVAVQVDMPVLVELTCTSTAAPPDVRISWTEYITNPNGAIISDGEYLMPSHPNSARYEIVTDLATTWDLKISPFMLIDGGAYRCIDQYDVESAAYAQVIAIEKAPNCTSNIPDSGYVREDQYYTMECSVFYQGQVAPSMFFNGPEGYIQATVKSNTTVWSGFRLNMTRFMDGYTFDLKANFTEEGFIQDNYASNVPTWSYDYLSPVLIVQWEPKKLYVVPEQAEYDVGQVLECHADANPPETIFWQNVNTHETWYDYRLYLTDAFVGTQTMRCNAANNITGTVYTADLFFNLTVKPRTTTPPPTTTPTPTTQLPEAPCDDLNGRWNAYEPTAVDMCLEINNTNYGRVIGIVRNATDPFFIEVRGRISPEKYNQIGFTGIWPSNIGTVTYVGTCRKCYGEEKLTLTGIGRTVTDNLSCQNVSSARYIPPYVFYRVGTVCRGKSSYLAPEHQGSFESALHVKT